jgi:hypothetical protein
MGEKPKHDNKSYINRTVAGKESIAEFYDIGGEILGSIMAINLSKLGIQKVSSSQELELLTIYEVV